MRTGKQNFLYKMTHIHSPETHRREIFSRTEMCQVLLTLSKTCPPHTATSFSQRNGMKSISIHIKNYGCSKEPFWQKSVTERKVVTLPPSQTPGIGDSRNRFWHKVELKKKSSRPERTPAITKTIQMPLREPHVCKSERAAFFAKHILELPKQPSPSAHLEKEFGFANIYLPTDRTVKKHFFQTQKTSLHNVRSFHTVQDIQTWRAEQVGMEKLLLVLILIDVVGTNHKMPFRTAVCGTKPPDNQFKDVWHLKWVKPCKKASYSWRHIVFWKNQDKWRKVTSQMGLGHKAIAKMGRKLNCKSTDCKEPKNPARFKMRKVQAKDHALERHYRRRLPA